MKMPPIPCEVPKSSELPREISVCHLLNPGDGTRLCSCPCATLDIAITLAQTNLETLNLVEGLGHYSAWRHGAQIFSSTTPAAFAAWQQQHLKQKDSNHDRIHKSVQNQRRSNARHVGGRTNTRTESLVQD